jgi:hypothetical protein
MTDEFDRMFKAAVKPDNVYANEVGFCFPNSYYFFLKKPQFGAIGLPKLEGVESDTLMDTTEMSEKKSRYKRGNFSCTSLRLFFNITRS